MNKQELLNKVSELTQAAQQFEEPKKTFKLDDVSELKISIESMSVSDIAEKMRSIDLPSMQEMEDSIQKANEATNTHSQRVDAFNKAYSFIKGAIVMVV